MTHVHTTDPMFAWAVMYTQVTKYPSESLAVKPDELKALQKVC